MPKPSSMGPGRTTRMAAVLIIATTLSGCATLRASQDAFLPSPAATAIDIRQALENYYARLDSDRLDMSRRDYRDYVAGALQSGVENRYKQFVDELQAANRGSALGLNLLVLGLSGVTAIASKSAIDELATATTVAIGARASIDKDLFFERTLPAVISSMDAERAGIKAEIARKRAQPAERYSLRDAIDDLHRLEQAGSVERAFSRMTKAAADDKEANEARLDAIVAACDEITHVSGAQAKELRVFLSAVPARSASRHQIAGEILGVTGVAGAPPTWLALASPLELNYCDDNARRAVIDQIKATIADRERGT